MSVRKSKVTGKSFVYPRVRDLSRRIAEKVKEELRIYQSPVTHQLISAILKQPEYSNYSAKDFYELLDSIAKVETNDSNIPQQGGGPGKGYFQIEDTSLPTAVNRLKEYQKELGFNVNINLDNISPENLMEQPKDVQQTLALANMLKAARSKGTYLDPKDKLGVWINYHWAGPDSDKEERIRHWNETLPSSSSSLQTAPVQQLPQFGGGGLVGDIYDVSKISPRIGTRKNEDGTESTHLMGYTHADGKWIAHPTLFQNTDGSWIEGDFNEAIKRKEIYPFDNRRDAVHFSRGSWKK